MRELDREKPIRNTVQVQRRLNLLSLGEERPFRIRHPHRSHNAWTPHCPPPLVQAAEAGHLPLVRLLLARGDRVDGSDRTGLTALMQACAHGHTRIAYLLLARGASARAKTTSSGSTPLLMALHSVEMETMHDGRLVSRGSLPLLRLLICKGADVNTRDDFGTSILSYAVIHGRIKAVRLLLAHGADVNAQSRFGNTPLIQAVGYGSLPLVRLLLAAGADPALCT